MPKGVNTPLPMMKMTLLYKSKVKLIYFVVPSIVNLYYSRVKVGEFNNLKRKDFLLGEIEKQGPFL